MREIVYQEAARGVFEPVLTRAQKRQAKLTKERRAERVDTVLSIAGLVAIFIIFAAIGAADLWGTRLYVQ